MKNIFITHQFKSKEEWLKHQGIGGSSASAILNLNPFMSANDLYDSIVHPREIKEIENEATVRGVYFEPLIRKKFEYLNRDFYKVKPPPKNNWLFQRIDKPYLTASLDGILTDLKTKKKGILEIKTKEVKHEDEILEWQNGEIPNNYYIQLLHYLMVTGFEFAVIVVELIKKDYSTGKVIKTVYNQQTIFRKDKKRDIEILEKEETKFYENCKKKIRPKIIINCLSRKE